MRTSDFDPISVDIFNSQLQRATIIIIVAFSLLILRLWFLQIVNGWTYRTQSESNRIHLQDIPPFRGVIFDRNGKMLVDNRPAYDLCLIPEEIQDPESLLPRLHHLVDFELEEVKKKLKKGLYRYPFRPITVKKNISRDELAIIETHRFNLSGVIIEVAPRRHYIHAHLASHLLGYLGEINESQLASRKYPNNRPGDLIGKSGAERKWENLLNGARGGEQVEVDAAGRKLRVISRRPPSSGSNLFLTLDMDLQNLAEKSLEGKTGAIVALDPTNGQILALASKPSFDPNLFIWGIDKETWKSMASSKAFPLQNRAISGQYPPGSVFKIVVAVAGLEEDLVDPEEEIVCRGSYTLGNHTYHCWKKNGHGKMDFHRAIVESCDVYFYKLGKKLGVDKIAEYATKFGLGVGTGFDLGNEKNGLIPTRRWKLKKIGIPWQTGETISTSIGQSFVLSTPIQAVNLISATFNGGNLFSPQATLRVEGTKGNSVFKFRPKLKSKVAVKPESLELVKQALIGVVNGPHGTGWRTKFSQVKVAGKTGTAQVVALEKEKMLDEEGQLPEKFRDHAWFVAVAPADDPQIALAVLIENGGHGGSASAPVARELIKAYLKVEK